MSTDYQSHLPNGRFGRVSEHEDKFSGRPYLRYHDIEVDEILSMIDSGYSDEDICKLYNDKKDDSHNTSEEIIYLIPDDIHACRSYQARFMPDTLKSIFNRVSSDNMVMMDENMSYMILPTIVRLFGRSSHVLADGLCYEHNDDEKDIWAHMIKNRYKAVIRIAGD